MPHDPSPVPKPAPDLATLLAQADSPDAGVPRRRGRPRADTRVDRLRRVEVAHAYLSGLFSADQTARAFKISRRTLHRYVVRALTEAG